MKQSTKRRKAASRHIPKVVGQDAFFTEKLVKVVAEGKAAFDSLSFELGRTLAEAIMYMDREQVSGPDYLPTSSEIQKWASQPGSVFIGDQKVKVERPRLRGPEGEIHLQSYQKLKERGLRLSKRVIFITDGGKGVIKALRNKYGEHLIHQRCTIHKDRNIQKHLPKKYRKKAHEMYTKALALTSYKDAKYELLRLETWLSEINASAGASLREALEEILTVHRLKVPPLLRKTLHTTNPIESMFSVVRKSEHNIKRYRNSKMAQRWLGAILLMAKRSLEE